MLVNVGFIILTLVGSVLSGNKPSKCNNPDHSCPKNEHYTRNNPRCIRTCANKWVPISDDCKPFTGCICNYGLVRLNDDGSGPCVPERKCPNKCIDPNAIYKKCPNPCPLSCDHPFPKVCTKACKEKGCECAPGFILDCKDINGKCIRPKDCPKPIRCPKHSHYVINDNQCPKTCGNRLLPNSDETGACAPFTGCACKPGYVRKYDNATGPCIKVKKCSPIPTDCGVNEVPTSCAVVCPPQTCDSIFSKYYCLPTECEPGCDCLNGFLRNDYGVCIPSDDCFKPDPIECNGPNEIYSDCAITCPPQSCDSLFVDYLCAADATCAPGCNCLDGYLRNSLGVCVPIEECCNDPGGCKGDLNATCVPGCGNPNRPTCENPEPKGNDDVCVLHECQCKQGYIVGDDGNCITVKDCPDGSPKCGANKTYVDCKYFCPTNYCPVDDSRAEVACSMAYPCQGGCACIAGHLIVSHEDRRCVLASDCPEVECTRPNEVWDPNPSGCFYERCDDRSVECHYPYPAAPRCVCKEGYCRNDDDICVPASECPPLSCKGDYNATLKKCPNPCPKTCDDPEAGDDGCIEICLPKDCQCNDGYFLTKIGGTCIKPEDCESCKGDYNAVYSYCPSACEPTCEKPEPNQVCNKKCMPPGCICRDGYVLNKKTGKCVKPESCPKKGCGGDPNAVYSDCPTVCEPTCDNPDPQICTLQCLEPGCVCKSGYVKSAYGKCIKPEDCPDVGCNGDCNATFSNCPSYCPLTCDDQDSDRVCITLCAPSGCECKPGYVLTAQGKCVLPKDCPVKDKGCNGDPNATYSECPSSCPVTCENRHGKGNVLCPTVCDPSFCVCKKGYILTKKGGKCVKPEDCPGCNGDPNAEYKQCPSACEPTCTNPAPEFCTKQCMPPGCVCKNGFVLNEETGKCVELKKCPGCKGDPNAEYSTCPSACEPTCRKPDPQICTLQCLPPGCVCKMGFVLNEATGKCVERENCPAEPQCGEDRNATYDPSPSYCQATCKHPDPEEECMDMPMPPGCVCKLGYIRRTKRGECIKPEDCPGGWPTCRENETYVYCNAGCPTDYCPVDDSLAIVACDAPYPCPGGCACKAGYLMVSVDDDRCILSSECPPVTCTRPNEIWDPYAPGCLHEGCDDKDIPCDWQYPGPPRCRCIKGYYRNQDGICVPECECPKPGCNGDLNATFSYCPSKCPATCCEPDSDRICTKDCDEPGCVCKDGYILSKPGGPCIDPYDCDGGSPHCSDNMTYTSCKIDCPTKYCPQNEDEVMIICDPVWPCPMGCECKQGYLMTNTPDKTCILAADCPPVECTRPNEVWDPSPSICNYERCEEMYYECNDPTPGRPKCVCKPGYYRDHDGVCIPAKECPKSEPICGYNEVAVPCRQICPPQNCEIAYTDYACTEEHKICEPGCDCLPDHLRNGSGICIPNDQCPYPSTPVCGINEIARDCRRICPPQTCLSKYALFRCVADLPCEPGCDCIPNYLRDERGICIPSEKCPAPCQIPDECKRTCAEPNPPNCVYNPPKENMDCCDCKEGYILSELGGKCIPIDQCPPDVACHGDPNARPKRCPKPCPSTCEWPNQVGCKRMCEPIACECKSGFLLSNNTETGRCILPDKCPGGNPCGKNSHFVDCKTNCPHDYCPVDDSRDIVFCDPTDYCLSGCICNINHKRKSRADPRCIRSSKCHPVNCTRPNEIWNSCPSACLAENCEDVNHQPTVCNTLVLNCEPKCICKKNYYRNSSGICVCAEDCPPLGCGGDPNAEYSECPSACPRTCNNPDPQICTAQCLKPGCVCKKGFVLNVDTGMCVKRKNCPVPVCEDPNAVYKHCPSACEPTCDNPEPEMCTDQCMPPSCVCKEGYVLNEKDGKCVEKCNCPGH